MMKALVMVACLLALSQDVTSEEDSSATEEKTVQKLSERATQVLLKVAHTRAIESVAAKKSSLAEILMDRSDLRYTRDIIPDILDSTLDDMTEFFESVCDRDIDLLHDYGDNPVGLLEIVAHGTSIVKVLDSVEFELDQLNGFKQNLADFIKSADSSDRAVTEYVNLKTDVIIGSLLTHARNLKKDGVCALGGLSFIVSKLIQHGFDRFFKGQTCYYFSTTLYEKLAQFDYSAERMADNLASTNFAMTLDFSNAIMQDMDCIFQQIQDLRQLLTKGTEIASQPSNGKAWDFTVAATWDMFHIVVEYHTLIYTLPRFMKLKDDIDQYLDLRKDADENDNESSAPDRGRAAKMLQELKELLAKRLQTSPR